MMEYFWAGMLFGFVCLTIRVLVVQPIVDRREGDRWIERNTRVTEREGGVIVREHFPLDRDVVQ